MVWSIFKRKTQAQKAAEKWEQHAAEVGGADVLFRQLGKDLNEEARVKAVAIAKSQYEQQPLGGWIEKTGRKVDRTGFFENMYNLLFRPGQFDLFVFLALLSALLHSMLIGSWVYDYLSESGDPALMVSTGMESFTANDTATRLATMYVAGHALCIAVLLHVWVAGEVTPLVPPYGLFMVIATVVGGPTCALCVSAHCEEVARHTASVALRHHERQASLADSMQWVYLVGLAVVASATALAFGTPALNPAVVGFSPLNLAAFYAWPLEVAASADWLTRLSASLVVDWVGVFLFGVVHAVYSQRGDVEGEGPPPGLLGASDGYDLLMRWGILLLGAFPNPCERSPPRRHATRTSPPVARCRPRPPAARPRPPAAHAHPPPFLARRRGACLVPSARHAAQGARAAHARLRRHAPGQPRPARDECVEGARARGQPPHLRRVGDPPPGLDARGRYEQAPPPRPRRRVASSGVAAGM